MSWQSQRWSEGHHAGAWVYHKKPLPTALASSLLLHGLQPVRAAHVSTASACLRQNARTSSCSSTHKENYNSASIALLYL